MRLLVEDIKEGGLSLEFEEGYECFTSLKEMAEAGQCRFTVPIKARLKAQMVAQIVELDGEVETVATLSCDRCVKEFEVPVKAKFSVAFCSELPELSDDDEDGAEIRAEDMGLTLYHGDEIELDEVIAEQVVLAVPVHPLCEKQCKGLCSSCGANLNDGPCECKPKEYPGKFAALKDFKVEK